MKKYLLTGLLVWTPLAITVWVLSWLLGLMDGVFAWLLAAPQALLPASAHASIERLRHVPGLGVLVMGLGLLLTGMFATNIFGQWWLRQWSRVLHKIPIVRSVYSSVKQVSDTLFSSSGNAFREAVLVQYPRPGAWTIAFVSVYVPTTPNPTSGFFLMMPRADVVPLEMSVDEALKYIISMGVVAPPSRAPAVQPARNPVS